MTTSHIALWGFERIRIINLVAAVRCERGEQTVFNLVFVACARRMSMRADVTSSSRGPSGHICPDEAKAFASEAVWQVRAHGAWRPSCFLPAHVTLHSKMHGASRYYMTRYYAVHHID